MSARVLGQFPVSGMLLTWVFHHKLHKIHFCSYIQNCQHDTNELYIPSWSWNRQTRDRRVACIKGDRLLWKEYILSGSTASRCAEGLVNFPPY